MLYEEIRLLQEKSTNGDNLSELAVAGRVCICNSDCIKSVDTLYGVNTGTLCFKDGERPVVRTSVGVEVHAVSSFHSCTVYMLSSCVLYVSWCWLNRDRPEPFIQ